MKIYYVGLIIVLPLTACFDSSGTDMNGAITGSTSVQLSGVVFAPGGTVAFNPSTGLKKFFVSIFGNNVMAVPTGTEAVSSATVDLLEVDEAGAQVGEKLATATTGSDGRYTLDLPGGFVPASKYIVRAAGSGSDVMDAAVTTIDEDVDVDPVTHATRGLIVDALLAKTNGKLADLKLSEIKQMLSEIRALENNLDLDAVTTLGGFVKAFKDEAKNNEEVSNVINSALEAGEICGSVTDSSGSALKNILVIARDYGNWVTRAKTLTDDAGSYCLNVPENSDYILGALNFTSLSTAGSEWWTCEDAANSICGSAVQLDAEKISVESMSLSRNFLLESGVRVEGKVTTDNTSVGLRRIQVLLRTFDANIATMGKRTTANGGYRINMRPGIYKMFARNSTRVGFASEAYNPGFDGGLNFREGLKVDLTDVALLGTTYTANFTLGKGFPIGGQLMDAAGQAIAGARVSFRQNGTVNVRRTNKQGKFRLQLRPGLYTVLSYGQRKSVVIPRDAYNNANVFDISDMPLEFNAAVGTVKMRLLENCDVNGANGTVVSQAKALLFRSTSSGTKLFAAEPTNADGTSELHIDAAKLGSGKVRFAVRVDDGKFAGSIMYEKINGFVTTFAGGSDLRADINAATDKVLDIGDICLPDAGIVTGTVMNSAGQPVVNALVSIMDCSSDCTPGANFIKTRTNIEGKYKVSLPAGMSAGLRVQTSRIKGVYSDTAAVTVVADEAQTVDISISITEPLGLFGSEGNAQVVLNWKPVLGASSYNLYMGTSIGIEKTDTGIADWMSHSASTTSYTHTGLTNDTAYYFVVTAVDATGEESEISEEIALTPTLTATGG